MDETLLPPAVVAAATDRQGGATEVARRALDGLLEVAGQRELLEVAVRALLAGQPAMAPLWHVARAARGDDPAVELARLRVHLEDEAEAAVLAAVAWLGERRGPVRTVSHSSLVDRVLERLGPRDEAAAPVGLAGADALGPTHLLNATGTLELAGQAPTLVIATTLKLVPAAAFDRLAAPGFERVPLESLEAAVVGPELLAPEEAGARAAALA